MSGTHNKKLARMVAIEGNLSYTQALMRVQEASSRGLLRNLGEGLQHAVGVILAMDLAPWQAGPLAVRLGSGILEGSSGVGDTIYSWPIVISPLEENRAWGVLMIVGRHFIDSRVDDVIVDGTSQGAAVTVIVVRGSSPASTYMGGNKSYLIKDDEPVPGTSVPVVKAYVEPGDASRVMELGKRGGITVLCGNDFTGLEGVMSALARESRSTSRVFVVASESASCIPLDWDGQFYAAVVDDFEGSADEKAALLRGTRSISSEAKKPSERYAYYVALDDGIKLALPPGKGDIKVVRSFTSTFGGQPGVPWGTSGAVSALEAVARQMKKPDDIRRTGSVLLESARRALSWEEVDWPQWVPGGVVSEVEALWAEPQAWAKCAGVKTELVSAERAEVARPGVWVRQLDRDGRTLKGYCVPIQGRECAVVETIVGRWTRVEL